MRSNCKYSAKRDVLNFNEAAQPLTAIIFNISITLAIIQCFYFYISLVNVLTYYKKLIRDLIYAYFCRLGLHSQTRLPQLGDLF